MTLKGILAVILRYYTGGIRFLKPAASNLLKLYATSYRCRISTLVFSNMIHGDIFRDYGEQFVR